jgi:hypothetical protein
MNKIVKKSTVLLLIAALLIIPFETTVFAEDDFVDSDPSAGAMVFDFILVRPGGAVATAAGAAAFVVTLPFSLLGWNVGTAAEKLLADPIKFTFFRPLGDF